MGAPKEAFLLICGFVLVEGWRGGQARETVPEIVPPELGLERMHVKERRIGKEISGKGKEKESV